MLTPEPGTNGRLAILEDHRRELRADLARFLLRGARPPGRLSARINDIRRTELELGSAYRGFRP